MYETPVETEEELITRVSYLPVMLYYDTRDKWENSAKFKLLCNGFNEAGGRQVAMRTSML